MAENFGNGGDKKSESIVQRDLLEGALPNKNEADGQTLSQSVMSDEIRNLIAKNKQIDSEDCSTPAAKLYIRTNRMLGGNTPGALPPDFSWDKFRHLGGDLLGPLAQREMQKLVQISDCGFGESLASTKRQNEIQESMRRIRQIDLKPYMWNTTDILA